MSDVCRPELQWLIDGLCKYLGGNRNHLAQELYKEMHRNDYLGDYGHINLHNDMYSVKITIHRKRRQRMNNGVERWR